MQYNINLYNSLLKMSDKLIQLNTELENPNIDIKKVASINKQLKRINEINEKFLLYKKMIENGTQSEEILSTSKDDELKEMAQMELNQIKEEIGKVENELKISLLPADPYAERNIIVEMRSAAGGDEASIFVADLFETYKRYSEHKNWNIEIIDISVGTFGYDNIYFSIKGDDVYQRMKFEGGVHRVQRIPATESKGRVHTSTITVSVMPELDEIDIKIRPEDLRIETSRSGGAGGQHVNKVESAIRIVHLPTGIVAACDAERSQIKNKEKAMKMLYARI
jgi:peptide chain release factor 1